LAFKKAAMYPREMGVVTGTNGFISTSKMFTASIYREWNGLRSREKEPESGNGG
jgi:hypothetical protein